MNRKELTILKNKRMTRVRGKLKAKSTLPRLVITRSLKHISAQLIDTKGNVQAEVTSKNQSFEGKTKTEQAEKIGQDMAVKLKTMKITAVVLDRSYYRYHGRIKALREAIKSSGINI